MEGVREFLELFRPQIEHDIVPISDVYGPTATDSDIQALVVSKETIAGGRSSTLAQCNGLIEEIYLFLYGQLEHFAPNGNYRL